MRDELDLMELADRYLRGEMNATERAAFEERMRTHTELRERVEDQRALLGGMQRLALRPAVEKAYRSYRFGKWAPGIGGAAVIVILAVGGWMLTRESGHSAEWAGDASVQVELRLPLNDTTGTGLPALVMMIDPKADTTLLTPNGLVLDIPQGAFVDEAGRVIARPVRVTLLEAIDGVDIMKAGLSTMSGDTLLETGGMFYIDAQVDGQRVGIDPLKPLTVMVPSDQADPRMMLYEGAMTEEGVVNWRDPKPLPRTLVPVDITTLDFHPPGFLAKVAVLGKDATDKAYTDSLYAAFECGPAALGARTRVLPSSAPVAMAGVGMSVNAFNAQWSELATGAPTDSSAPFIPCGVSPARVRAIWNERFNGTNLATREFEERMREIHRTCDNAVLDLYVQNLNTDLSVLDMQVARMGHAVFSGFARQNVGQVALPPDAAVRLRQVYEAWSRAGAEAARRTHQHFWDEQVRHDQQSDQRRTRHSMTEQRQQAELFQKEFAANLAEACRQLGINKTGPSSEPPITAYVVRVTNPGWWNVDRAVFQATADRSSMEYRDPNTGRKAVITYKEVVVNVVNAEVFEELQAYLIPQGLNSYQRMDGVNGRFTSNRSSALRYDLFCMGMQGDRPFAAYRRETGDSTHIRLEMHETDEHQLRRLFSAADNALADRMLELTSHQLWSIKDARRRTSNAARAALHRALLPVVFPCASLPDTLRERERLQVRTDRPARFPGGKMAMDKYLTVSQRSPVDPFERFILGTVEVHFWVNVDGSISQIQVAKPLHWSCDKVARQLVRDMPRWEPAITNGRPRAAKMSVDVRFVGEE
ncbi:MAG: energy transducer TonB [Flavobacteriales bacterium]|nr:energy transducer TonB [Flavobacteriales bacterium]